MEKKNSVLANGLDFVLYATNNLLYIDEDNIEPDTQQRLAKYALLHFSSGVELILKYRLLCEHWTYIFHDMNKATKRNFETGDFKSADINIILERLESLCNVKIPAKDEQILKRIRNARNKMEHFTLNETYQFINAIVHQGLSVLIHSIAHYFDISKFTEEENELLSELKSDLTRFDRHYKEMKTFATLEITQLGLQNDVLPCPACGEDYFISNMKCCFCGHTELDGEDAAYYYMENILGISGYLSAKEGQMFPVYTCPICGHESFLYDTKNEKWICYTCYIKYNEKEVALCEECEQPYLLREHDDMYICPDCIENKLRDE